MKFLCPLILMVMMGCGQKKIHDPIQITTLYDLAGTGLESNQTEVTISFDEAGIKFTAVLEEEDIRAKLNKHDTLIYLDPCIEFFLDPGADGKDYYEVEINALGYGWALKLATNNSPLNAATNMSDWNIRQSYSTKVYGTLNDDADKDKKWVANLECRWSDFAEGAPQTGDVWAYNVMRVDYDGITPTYWVAKPTGQAMIHHPSLWPRIQF